jgi:hypothetical protein
MFASSAMFVFVALVSPAADLFVTPDGKPDGDGSRARPWDLATTLTGKDRVRAGDTVWLGRGTYRGAFLKPAQPSGTAGKPIIYRAMPGQRVTLTANEDDRCVLEIAGAEYVWFWGMEVTVGGRPELGHYGAGVSLRGGREIKLINLQAHCTAITTGRYGDRRPGGLAVGYGPRPEQSHGHRPAESTLDIPAAQSL